MPKRTKVETRGFGAQTQAWIDAKKTESAIANDLNQIDPEGKYTQQDIDRFKQSVLRRVNTPTPVLVRKWNKDAGDAYDTLQVSLETVGKIVADDSLDVNEKLKAIAVSVVVAKEKLILLRQYPERGPAVVQINIAAQQEFAAWLRGFEIPIRTDERGHLLPEPVDEKAPDPIVERTTDA